MQAAQQSSPEAAVIPEVSAEVLQHVDRYRDAFDHADHFKHVMIENFLEPSFAEQLLTDFPSFNPRLARNEYGDIGGKAVNTQIREISPVYQRLYAVISSKPFLEFMSRLSGIPDLLIDPKMFGGGTHDNRHGQELDPHVDFNYDESEQLHRRLNLIVYLNKEWETEWGGALEIHSNPRRTQENQIESFDPLFNRAVMFETNEYSWHGFPKIDLPADKRHLSRKSLSIYLYTKDRPAEEIAPMHATFYVQRPLPQHIAAGRTLSEQDVTDLALLLKRRDDWIEFYHRLELEKNRELAKMRAAVAHLMTGTRAPLTGYILQSGAPAGLYTDGWASSHVEVQVRPLMPVSAIVLRGWRPDSAPPGRVRIAIDRQAPSEFKLGAGSFEAVVPVTRAAQETFHVQIDTQAEGQGLATSGDDRDLAFVLVELRARHPGVKDSG
jgi:Rps23 Pro-64 3,4-dihydroxylase Tpa1-like proline 4-hydroxylase